MHHHWKWQNLHGLITAYKFVHNLLNCSSNKNDVGIESNTRANGGHLKQSLIINGVQNQL